MPANRDPDSLDWDRTFDDCFLVSRGDDQREIVPAGAEARLTGRLTLDRLAVGVLQSGSAGKTPSGEPIRRNNPTVRRILKAQRKGGEAKVWGPAAEHLTGRATDLLRQAFFTDPSLGNQQFVLYYDGDALRLRPFGAIGAARVEGIEQRASTPWLARIDAIEPSSAFGVSAIAELEELIDSSASERDFQRFFEQHPDFLTALGNWRQIHPQLVLHRDEDGPLIPDMFLERLDSDFCDVLDLKLPTAELIRRQKNRTRFRSCVLDAVAQLREYRDWFEHPSHRSAFRDRYGLDAYRPKAVLVIGRRASFYDDVERIRLESDLPPWIEFRTYDDILASVRHWRERSPF